MTLPLTADEAGQLAMVQILLVAVGAGAASALLFASVATGSLLATLLFYLASLPILIAAMGWSHLRLGLSPRVRHRRSRARLSASFPLRSCSVSDCRPGGSAIWRCSAAPCRQRIRHGGTEWYPIGRLVLWAAISARWWSSSRAQLGTDKETFQTEIRNAMSGRLRSPGARRRIAGDGGRSARDRHPGKSRSRPPQRYC